MMLGALGFSYTFMFTSWIWPTLYGHRPTSDFPPLLGLMLVAAFLLLFLSARNAEQGDRFFLWFGGLVLAIFAACQLVEAVGFERDVLTRVPARFAPILSFWAVLVISLAAWGVFWACTAFLTARSPARGEPLSAGLPVTPVSSGVKRPGTGQYYADGEVFLKALTSDPLKLAGAVPLFLLVCFLTYVALSLLAGPFVLMELFSRAWGSTTVPQNISPPAILAVKFVQVFLNATGGPSDKPSVLIAVHFVQSVLVFLPLVALMTFVTAPISRLGERILAPDVEATRKIDHRAPVFLIRSFKDDRARVRVRLGIERLIAIFLRTVPFELLLVEALGGYGPVVTIGQPTESLRRIGAAREYLDGGTWRDRVREYMAEAAALVIIVGDTSNFAWECERAIELGMQGRMLFVFPPLADAELKARWERLSAIVVPARGVVFPQPHDGHILTACFPLAGKPIFCAAKLQAADTYRRAVGVAMGELALAT